MTSLDRFGVQELMALRATIRSEVTPDKLPTFEDAAAKIVTLLRDEFRGADGEPECALVRVYKTLPYSDLPDDLRSFARSLDPDVERRGETRCLVLMATVGDEPAWNSRFESRGHRAIPLTSDEVVAQAPMVSQLIQQLGLPVGAVLRPDPSLLLDIGETAQNVFYVPNAAGSPYIVAQDDFVRPYGIESVIGFGGLMASGDLVAAILFSKVKITPAVADHFRVVGLNFKLAMLPFVRKPSFRN